MGRNRWGDTCGRCNVLKGKEVGVFFLLLVVEGGGGGGFREGGRKCWMYFISMHSLCRSYSAWVGNCYYLPLCTMANGVL